MMRSPNGSRLVAAHDRVAGHAGLAAAGGHLADDLALERLLVETALAGHDERRAAHQLVEADRVEHVGGARHESRVAGCPEPARQPAGGSGHRLAARIAREALGQLGQASARGASPSRDRRPSAARTRAERPRTGCARRRARPSRHPHAGLLECLERARSAVGGGRAAHGHDHLRSAGLHGGHDQLAGAARGRRPGVALGLVDETQAAGLGRLHHRRAVRQEREARLDRTPERIGRP